MRMCKRSERAHSPCQRSSSQRRLPLRRRDKLVGVHDVAAADLETVKHCKAVERVFESGGAELELPWTISDKGACDGV